MQERWFADNRDLVKWATLLHIAREQSIRTIVQVPYLRSEAQMPSVRVGDADVSIDPTVWRFFRDVRRIEELGVTAGITIRVIAEPFISRARAAYVEHVFRAIADATHPLLVFLDPDTGLEPQQVGAAHTTTQEVRDSWTALAAGDWLALYQHARRTKTWIEDVRTQFADACDGANVTVARSADVGTDVAFFAARKQ
jgi:hypothetical protein